VVRDLLIAPQSHAQIRFRISRRKPEFISPITTGRSGKSGYPKPWGLAAHLSITDNDGYPDILLVNGEDWPGHPHGGATTPKLYHNNRNGTFTMSRGRPGSLCPCSGWESRLSDYDTMASRICS